MTTVAAPNARHYGLDWLRVAAFALLIAYHVGMVFSPYAWVIKWPHTQGWLTVPMALLTPWRLPLLFVVSGFAMRKLLARQTSVAGFARGRSARLLIPLAFAMIVLLPPELWVRARVAGETMSLPHYWLTEYWSPRPRYGLGFPAWEHLWFVTYLWTYTMLLAALVAWRGAAAVDRLAEAITANGRMLWAPVVLLAVARLSLMFVVPERHTIASDWVGHAVYVPMFLAGFVLAGSARLWARLHAHAQDPATWAVAALSGACVALVEHAWPGTALPPHAIMAAERAAQVAMAWSVVLLLVHAADRWLNHDHRWRTTFAEAVFPAYLVHHPVLVVATWAILPLGLSAGAGFVVLLTVTVGSCALFYLVGRDLRWARPLIGLAPARTPAARPQPVAIAG